MGDMSEASTGSWESLCTATSTATMGHSKDTPPRLIVSLPELQLWLLLTVRAADDRGTQIRVLLDVQKPQVAGTSASTFMRSPTSHFCPSKRHSTYVYAATVGSEKWIISKHGGPSSKRI